MPTKPWDSLTNLERREAIARRLGWTHNYRDPANVLPLIWQHPTNRGYGSVVYRLPDWPTNDGLAFAEVWPKINCRWFLALGMHFDEQDIPGVWCCNTREYVSRSNTWADAICRAAYELLEVKEC